MTDLKKKFYEMNVLYFSFDNIFYLIFCNGTKLYLHCISNPLINFYKTSSILCLL